MTNTVDTIIFDVTAHSKDYPEVDYNSFADYLRGEGYTVEGRKEAGNIFMDISGIDMDTFESIVIDYGMDGDMNDYIQDDTDLEDSLSECVGPDCEMDECNECDDDNMFEDVDFIDEDATSMFDEEFEEDYDLDDEYGYDFPMYDELDPDAVDFDEDDEYMTDDKSWENIMDMEDDRYAEIDEAFHKNAVRLALNEKRKGCCPKRRRLNESTMDFESVDEFVLNCLKNKPDWMMIQVDRETRKSVDVCMDIDYATTEMLEYFGLDGVSEEKYQEYQDMLIDAFDSFGVKIRGGFNESKKVKRSGKLISMNEALKAFEDKDQKKLDKSKKSIDDILKEVKGQTIGASEVRAAFAKLKKENSILRKIKKDDKKNFNILDVPGVSKTIKALIAADPEKADEIKKFRDSLTESVVVALQSRKGSLHENVKLNGTKMGAISSKKLNEMYKSQNAKKKELTKALKEAKVGSAEAKALKEAIAKKANVMNYIMEELSYRKVANQVFKKLNEDEDAKDEKKDDENSEDTPSMDDLAAMFGSSEESEAEGDDADNKDDDDAEGKEEETEDVELARIVIQMASKEDAELLVDLCKDAGIPEGAMEIEAPAEEGDETEESSDDTEAEDADTEESNEDGADAEQNESVKYSNLRRLFEADEEEETTDEEGAEGEEAEATEDAEPADSEYNFILTDTDYVSKLAEVLTDEYGITKEEFEEMIGGEIVEDDEEIEDDEEDKSEDKKGKDDDEEEDDMDVADIFGDM